MGPLRFRAWREPEGVWGAKVHDEGALIHQCTYDTRDRAEAACERYARAFLRGNMVRVRNTPDGKGDDEDA